MKLGDSIPGKSLLEAALGFIYPNTCQLCEVEQASASEGYVGGRCWSAPGGLKFIRSPYCQKCGLPYEGEISGDFVCGNCHEMKLHFNWARAAVVANPFLLGIIHRYKYQAQVWLEPFLGDLLIRRAAPELRGQGWDAILPVPLHPVKRRERAFNQAERLASYLGREVDLPVKTRLLHRVLPTRTQTRLSRRDRQDNVRQAFKVRRHDSLRGQRVILVDDVLTTGATTSACAKALLQAGVSKVGVWTVARGL